MSVMHQQAMNYVYQQVLTKLLGTFSIAQRAGVQTLIQRLQLAAGGAHRLGTYKIMLLVGGGKTSASSLALLRAAQLTLAARNQPAFRLRLVVCSHGALDAQRRENIHRCCNALFLHDDPRVEMLQFSDGKMGVYDPLKPDAASVKPSGRDELLVCGHMGGVRLHERLRDIAFVALTRVYQRLLTWRGGADAIVLDHSPVQRRRLVAWGMGKLRDAGHAPLPRSHWQGTRCLRALEPLAHTSDWPLPQRLRAGYVGEVREARFLPVFELMGNVPDYSGLLAFLGCRVAEPVFHTCESRHQQIALLAHIAGLRGEHVEQCGYAAGVQRALGPLLQLLTPEGEAGHSHRVFPPEIARERAKTLARSVYGFTETQLACLAFAPVLGQGAGMEAFLRACHPGMLVALPYLHKALQGATSPDQVTQWLQECSGLSLPVLQGLYRLRAPA